MSAAKPTMIKRCSSYFNVERHARWLGLSLLVGAVAGLGAVLFDVLLKHAVHLLIDLPMGLTGAPGTTEPEASFLPYLGSYWIVFIATIGGLASGLLVFNLAPEAEGHGTDAMIESFHRRGGFVRTRVPIVKLIASALTIGSGGSAGKEGPIAQIGSGFASFVATKLKLKHRERRILLLAGAAGGIGAIFQAPLGGALFVPEVLYSDTEFEFESILSCILSSIMAHAVFSQLMGRHALFNPGLVEFSMPNELPAYACFGILCAIVGFVYIKVFYGMRDHIFHKIPIPAMYKPALGAFSMGCIAFFYPEVIDGGYAHIQDALAGNFFWGTMLILAFMKIIATSFTISSGGSGGVFGPSVFIGAMLGGAFGQFGHQIAPAWVIHPSAFVLVGMGGFFAGVAKVPVSSIIMACEMSGSYTLLVPLMLVSTTSYLLLEHVSLYEKQVLNRISSPAHKSEIARTLLAEMYVHETVKERPITVINEALPFKDLVRLVTQSTESYFPVVNKDGDMTGILSINDIREIMFDDALTALVVAKDVATSNVVRVYWNDTLGDALEKMVNLNVNELPVVRRTEPDRIVSMISKQDIITRYYANEC